MKGIYCIECLVNSNHYIEASKNIHEAVSEELKKLRNDNHNNKELQQDFNKYGEDKFKFFLLVECDEDLFSIGKHILSEMILQKSTIYNDIENIKKYDKYSIFSRLIKCKKEYDELELKNILIIDSIISSINNTKVDINDLDISNKDICVIISMQELDYIFSKKDEQVLNDYKLISSYELEECINLYGEKIFDLYNDIKIKIFEKTRNKVKSTYKNLIVVSRYSKEEKINNVKIEKCENMRFFKYKANIKFEYSLKSDVDKKYTFNRKIVLKNRE